jgi:glycosyltransferase involved in cell wall biosynthesis
MPVSRSAASVTRSLNSVLAQSLPDIEILVGDDAGYGRDAVDRASDPRVRYRHNSPPRGFIGNHEGLLADARGQFIAFLHDDDRWEHGYLEMAVRGLQANPHAGFVLTPHREVPGEVIAPHPPAGCYEDALSVVLNDSIRVLPSATVLRRAVLVDVRRPWPPLSCGDMVLYLDAAVAGWSVAVIDAPPISYARHPGQISAEEIRFRKDLAQLFELYRFSDPEVEQLRLSRLVSSRLSLARAYLKAGNPRCAQANVIRARSVEHGLRARIEGMGLTTLSRHPHMLRQCLRAWYAVRGLPATANDAPPR